MASAVAVFPDKSTIVVPGVLNGDVEGKGILKIHKTLEQEAAAKKGGKSVTPPVWEGVSDHFGRFLLLPK